MHLIVNLSLPLRYENQGKSGRNHITRKQKGISMPKRWSLNDADKGQYQKNWCSIREAGKLLDIDSFSVAAISCGTGLKNQHFVRKYVDPQAVKSLIEERRASISRKEQAALNKQIISARIQARSLHLKKLAASVALGNWSSNHDLKSELAKNIPRQIPNILEHEGETVDTSNHPATLQFLETTYGNLTLDKADNEVNLEALEQLRSEVEALGPPSEPLIDLSVTLDAIMKTPKGKSPDPQGVVGECVAYLPYEVKSELQEVFEHRSTYNNWSECNDPSENHAKYHDNWKYVDTLLIPKNPSNCRIVDALDFRPIALLCVFSRFTSGAS